MKKIALLLPILAGTCWGSAALFIRALYDAGFDNVTITFSRQMVTSSTLALYMLICNKKLFRISKSDIPVIVLISILGYFGLNLCFNYSANMLSMSLASVLLCTAPVFVIIFSKIIFGENITKTKTLCMVAALVGCTLLSGVFEDGGLKWSLFGIVMGVGSSICNAGYTMVTNQAVDVRGCHPTTVLFYASSIAMILMIFSPDMFTMVAFDSGGAVTGPMTTSFLLPLIIGICYACNGNVLTDGFGLVALVALSPLITIQILGIIYNQKSKKNHIITTIDESIIDFKRSDKFE